MKTKLGFLILGLGLVFTLSCTKYPPTSDRILEDLAVITQYDKNIDFKQFTTFFIAPSIMKVTDRDTIPVTGSNVQTALDRIAYDMKAYGYTQVDGQGATSPDLTISVTYYENTYTYTYSPYYYYGYPWYGGYGYYYPYYPVYYSSYTAGIANIQLVDLKNVDPVKKVAYIRWNAYIRGLMTGSHTSGEVTSSIDKAFEQTPQLNKLGN